MVSKMNRPRILINCAMSVDGKIALPNGKQLRISSDEDMRRVHHLRNSHDGVLVGLGAVITDDPKLTVKKTYVDDVKQPIRIVLDTYCKTPVDALVINDVAQTFICCHENISNKRYGDHVKIIFCKTITHGELDLSDVLEKLYNHGISSLLVEGGGTVIWNFLKQGLVDDLFIYVGFVIIGGKETPTIADGKGILTSSDAIPLNLVEQTTFDRGMLFHYQL